MFLQSNSLARSKGISQVLLFFNYDLLVFQTELLQTNNMGTMRIFTNVEIKQTAM